jgi:hypothetical protein
LTNQKQVWDRRTRLGDRKMKTRGFPACILLIYQGRDRFLDFLVFFFAVQMAGLGE